MGRHLDNRSRSIPSGWQLFGWHPKERQWPMQATMPRCLEFKPSSACNMTKVMQLRSALDRFVITVCQTALCRILVKFRPFDTQSETLGDTKSVNFRFCGQNPKV